MQGRNPLHTYRLNMQATQAFMAQMMGVPLRTYEDLEAGRAAIRDVHLNAARYACLKILGNGGFDPSSLPVEVIMDLDKAGFALRKS